ncbi:hypothetical protein [Aureibaculum conchae]|uniref:hypothetical protein n=1 Tax=Aureibaculum sp. 2308TA14-22 TaxID=3108392 RepID=UPI0033953373
MKTVKLRTFGNYKISPNAVKGVPIAKTDYDKKKFINKLKREDSGVLLAINPGTKELDFLLQITDGEDIFASMFYEPILTFFTQAYDTYNGAKKAKLDFRVEHDTSEIKIVNTHDFSVFMQLKLNSIIMLQTSIEAFMNSVIPEGKLLYKNEEKTKKQIEKELSFKDKLRFLSDELTDVNFNINEKEDKLIYDSLLNLNNIRKELVHMKTNREEMFESFIESLRNALGFDLEKQFVYCINFINKIKPNYIELIDKNEL